MGTWDRKLGGLSRWLFWTLWFCFDHDDGKEESILEKFKEAKGVCNSWKHFHRSFHSLSLASACDAFWCAKYTTVPLVVQSRFVCFVAFLTRRHGIERRFRFVSSWLRHRNEVHCVVNIHPALPKASSSTSLVEYDVVRVSIHEQ